MATTASYRYYEEIMALMRSVFENQGDAIARTAEILTSAIKERRQLWIFGATHSSMMAAEVSYRAGGLALFNPLFAPGMWLDQRPATKTSKLENLPDMAKIVLNYSPAKAGDVLIVASTSGRNVVPIEMALEAKKMGLTVIALTSVRYSSAQPSNHPTGKRLFEIVDLVLDNQVPVGDAMVSFEGFPQHAGAASTVVGAFLLNAITAQVIENLLLEGITPPVFMSTNLEGGKEHNDLVLERYRDLIHYM